MNSFLQCWMICTILFGCSSYPDKYCNNEIESTLDLINRDTKYCLSYENSECSYIMEKYNDTKFKYKPDTVFEHMVKSILGNIYITDRVDGINIDIIKLLNLKIKEELPKY